MQTKDNNKLEIKNQIKSSSQVFFFWREEEYCAVKNISKGNTQPMYNIQTSHD